MATTTTPGYNKFDLTVTSSLLTALRVEIFNFDFSQADVYNPAVQLAPSQNYHPALGVGSAQPVVIANPAVANGYYLAYVVGGFDAYVNAANVAPPAGFNSQAYVYFDENGQLVYQPGYVAGVLDPGQVTIQSKQTNYKHVWRVSGKSRFTVNYIKVKVGAIFLDQLYEDVVLSQNNIVNDLAQSSFSPDTFQSENTQQQNIITVPVNTEINPKKGFWYNILPSIGGASNVIQMSIYFTPISANMLTLI